jgi:membrane-bound metal-dependent hydrolase YbcI (DUF457 family)
LPDLLTHFAVAFALTSPFLGARRGLVAGVIALLPDLDVLFHVHRSATHSVIVLLFFALPAAYLAHRSGVGLRFLAFAVASLLSHPILDVFQDYTPILYPFFDAVFIDVRAGFLFGEGIKPFFDLTVHTTPVDFTPFASLKGPVLLPKTLPLSLALILVPLLYSLKSGPRPTIAMKLGEEINP